MSSLSPIGTTPQPDGTQTGQNIQNLTEDEAREYIERLRWPAGPACPHCGSVNVYRMTAKSVRAGLLACRDCDGHFTVTVGTVMEDSHLPLATWVRAFHFIMSSKESMSAVQLQRNLGLGSYRTAWYLAHRIREAMKCAPVAGLLQGSVQCDETYVGGRPRNWTGKHKRGRETKKAPVVALVETGDDARSAPIEKANSATFYKRTSTPPLASSAMTPRCTQGSPLGTQDTSASTTARAST
jgi:transposase-like protein